MTKRNGTQLLATRLVGAKQASREYGFKYTSLRDLVHQGQLKVVRIGRAWYFDRTDLDEWIDTHKETGF